MGAIIKPGWLYWTRDAEGRALDVTGPEAERDTKPGEFKQYTPDGNYDKRLMHSAEARARFDAEKAERDAPPPSRKEFEELKAKLDFLEQRLEGMATTDKGG